MKSECLINLSALPVVSTRPALAAPVLGVARSSPSISRVTVMIVRQPACHAHVEVDHLPVERLEVV